MQVLARDFGRGFLGEQVSFFQLDRALEFVRGVECLVPDAADVSCALAIPVFRGLGLQARHDVGMFFGQVVALSEIGFQVVELFNFFPVRLDRVTKEVGVRFQVFPFPHPDPRLVEVKTLAALVGFSQEQIGLVDAIDDPVGGDLEAGEPGKGRHKINGSPDRITDFSRRHLPGPAHNAGRAVPAFVAGALAVAQRTGFAPENRSLGMPLLVLVVLGLIPRAVVGGVDDQGVVAQLELVELVEQAPGFEVELLDHVTVEVAGGLAPEFRRGIDNGMHHGMGEVEHEGLVLVALVFQVVHRFVGVHADEAAHVAGGTGRFVVLVKAAPASVVRTQRAEIVVKPLCVGHALDDRFPVGDIPLADARGLVTGRADQFGPGGFLPGHAPALAELRVTPGEQGGTRRAAHGLGVEGSVACAFLRQLIQARGLVLDIPVAGKVGITLIVGEDDHDIRFELFGAYRSARAQQDEA